MATEQVAVNPSGACVDGLQNTGKFVVCGLDELLSGAASDLHPAAVDTTRKAGPAGSVGSRSGVATAFASSPATDNGSNDDEDSGSNDAATDAVGNEGAGFGETSRLPLRSLPDCLRRTNLSALRFRKSCYFDATVRWGVQGFVPYNHMLLPIGFSSPEEEYKSLCDAVCLWDVAAQRQVELLGADALKLAELLTPRALGSMKVGECRYAMVTDEQGMVLNDPVVLKLAEDRFWFSLADSDLLLWIKGLAIAHGLDVRVTEPGVSPLAVQGPKSLALMRELFGDWVDDLRFYHFREVELDGMPMLLARSGWSPERGYELYLLDESRGDELWERIMEAGQKYTIRPGVPNQIRRLEGGLMSYGTDMTSTHNALELGLPAKWCSPDKAADFVGKEALRRLVASGPPRRQVLGLQFAWRNTDEIGPGPLFKPWTVRAAASGDAIGFVSSVCLSPAMGAYIAIATLDIEASSPGTMVVVETARVGSWTATVRKLPFMPRRA